MFNINYIFVLGSVIIIACGQIIFKFAAKELHIDSTQAYVAILKTNAYPIGLVVVALALYLISTVAWVQALRTIPLSIAFMMFAGRMTAWNETNLKALRSIQSRFHESNLETLATFAAARAAPWFPARLYLLYRSGVYRQTALAQIGLIVAACLRKL